MSAIVEECTKVPKLLLADGLTYTLVVYTSHLGPELTKVIGDKPAKYYSPNEIIVNKLAAGGDFIENNSHGVVLVNPLHPNGLASLIGNELVGLIRNAEPNEMFRELIGVIGKICPPGGDNN